VSAKNETLSRVLTVALGLCIVCSVVVSTAAVALKPQQAANKARDLKRNILMAGGLYNPELSVEEQFASIEPRVVDLDTGMFLVMWTLPHLTSEKRRKIRRVPKLCLATKT